MKPVIFWSSWLIAALLAAAASITFALSMNHPISADQAMLHYSAWLINERGFVFYRDIFELNFPAPFLFHSLLGQCFGYAALPLRFVDFALLSLLAVTTWKILAPLSRAAAVYAFSLFTLIYLINGGEFVLERDYLGILPAAAAFYFLSASTHVATPHWRAAIAGVLCALACSMKPNFVVMVPVLVWMMLRTRSEKNMSKLGVFFISALCSAAVPFIWVIQQGGLDAFIDIYKNFLPVYANSRYDLWHYDSTAERLLSLQKNYLLYGGTAILLAVPGLMWAWAASANNTDARQHIMPLALMTFAFTLYEVIAGKFWLNHMFPSAYWTCLCMALLLKTRQSWNAIFLLLTIFLLLVTASLGWVVSRHSATSMLAAYKNEATQPEVWRARQMAAALHAAGLKPDDTVQMLDIAGDGQAALLIAQATSATRHLIDVPLYMQPNSAATQALRQEFIQDLTAKKPAFIVYVDQFLHPGGGNRLNEFKALSTFIAEHYDIATMQDGSFTIFRRKPVTENR